MQRAPRRPPRRSCLTQVDDAEVARLADAGGLVDHRAQRLRHRRAGVEEIHIDAARPVMPGRHRLGDVAVPARPADAPLLHLAGCSPGPSSHSSCATASRRTGRGRLRAYRRGGGSSDRASRRRARPRPSSAPSRWRRRARSGCGRSGTPLRRARAASIAAYMPARARADDEHVGIDLHGLMRHGSCRRDSYSGDGAGSAMRCEARATPAVARLALRAAIFTAWTISG